MQYSNSDPDKKETDGSILCWESWGCSVWKREGSRDTMLDVFQYLKEAYKKSRWMTF